MLLYASDYAKIIGKQIIFEVYQMKQNYTRLKLACYSANVCMAIVGNLPPVLFLTFQSSYGISYSLLGTLVLINFFTQLAVDLVFSFFSHKFDIPKTVKLTPVITAAGFLLYALSPVIFPNNIYLGLALGTVVFSVSSGLSEVLISPVIAAIPADDPDREMSKLHSVYAWGSVFVIIASTLFLLAFGSENWMWLVFAFMSVPAASVILYLGAQIPKMETPEKVSGALALLKNRGVWLCVFAIFLGGAAECTMAQWCSGYLEKALSIPKVWGDIFGVALFSVALGMGRTLYAKRGKNIEKVLLLGAIGAAVCYFTAAVSNIAILGLFACAFTGFFVSMLWPGNLIVASDRFPSGGVFIFAMMAAGGDLGASVGPQLVGIITDTVSASPFFVEIAQSMNIGADQLGMKLGMLVGMLFPLTAIFVFARFLKQKKNVSK